MKSYTITVNGTVYDVTVEEKAGGAAAPAAPAQAAAPAPAPAQAPAPKAPAASGSAGSVEVTAPMPGKILAVKSRCRTECKERRCNSSSRSYEDGK